MTPTTASSRLPEAIVVAAFSSMGMGVKVAEFAAPGLLVWGLRLTV